MAARKKTEPAAEQPNVKQKGKTVHKSKVDVNKKAGPKKAAAKKKPARKKRVAKPIITEEMYEKWFFKLELDYFVELCKEWNENNLKIKIPKHENYDDWLNYFKTLSPTVIRQLAKSGVDFLPTEAYAALSRWHDIISHPSRIDKIHQSGLSKGGKQTPEQDIVALARNNDRMGVLMAVRDRIAEKLEKGAGARDTSSLAKEMGNILDQIAELEKRMGPKKGTKLNELLGEFSVVKPKRAPDGKGARHTSFRARTIDDLEAAK